MATWFDFTAHPVVSGFDNWFSDVVMCFLRPAGLHRMEREWAECGREWSMNWRLIEVTYFLFIWNHITVQSSRREPSANEQHVTKQFDWLISDRGPFHHSKGYLSFMERFRQGFTTRYKIYRWVINTMLVCTLYGLCSWLYMSFCWVLKMGELWRTVLSVNLFYHLIEVQSVPSIHFQPFSEDMHTIWSAPHYCAFRVPTLMKKLRPLK